MKNNKIILKLLRPGNQKGRMYGSWIALCVGLLLLFVAVLAWFDFREILSAKGREDTMAAYISVGKEVTNEVAALGPDASLFSEAEIRAIAAVPGVDDVGRLAANNFPVAASMGGNLGFYTLMFLGSVDNKYLDVLPEDWEWQPGQPTLPIIMSSDFLNLYNYGFAPSQGLPQLSQTTVKSLPFEIDIASGREKYRARIVGFTDRISSVLVPQRFMEEMNRKYAAGREARSSRLIVKVKDPSESSFVQYLKAKKYVVNPEQLRWNRIRTVVQAIVTSVGIVALIVVGMAALSFVLFIELTVQRASGHIRLMKQLGYAPRALRAILNRFFLPWISSAAIVSALLAAGLHLLTVARLKQMDLQVKATDVWIVAVLLVLILLLLLLLLRRSAARILRNV